MDYVRLIEAIANHPCLLDVNSSGQESDKAWEHVALVMGINKEEAITGYKKLQSMMEEKGETCNSFDDMVNFAYNLPSKNSGVRNQYIPFQVQKYPEIDEKRITAACRRFGPIVIKLDSPVVLGPAPVMPEDEEDDEDDEVEKLAENGFLQTEQTKPKLLRENN